MARPIWKLGFLRASVLIAVSPGAIIDAGYYHQLWQPLDRYSRLDVVMMYLPSVVERSEPQANEKPRSEEIHAIASGISASGRACDHRRSLPPCLRPKRTDANRNDQDRQSVSARRYC